MTYLGERPPYGSMLKNRNETRAEKKPLTPKQKRQMDPENDKAHLAAIMQLPCCIKGCGLSKDIHPHHLKYGVGISMGCKAKDRYVVPLCREHHIHGVHRVSTPSERRWFKENGISEVVALADGLWTMSPDHEKMLGVLVAHWEDIDD